MQTTLLGRIGDSMRTSSTAHREPVNFRSPNGWPSICATVRPAVPPPGSPSTAPNDMPPSCTNRAIRTRFSLCRPRRLRLRIYRSDLRRAATGFERPATRTSNRRSPLATLAVMTVLTEPQWRARKAAHEARVDGWVAAHRDRRRTGHKHPVEDFLFSYYSFRPSRLRRWHPGAGVALEGADPAAFGPDYRAGSAGVVLDAQRVRERRGEAVDWILTLLRNTAARPAHLGCFGMHEWAMVYRQSAEELRHSAWPLRLSPTETADVVDANRIRCSHFDAYRFFTESARPLNVLRPTRANQPHLDQPG